MTTEIILPDLGDDAEDTVTVSGWLAKIGDQLTEGDDLLEITTDKAAFCVPAPIDGKLQKTLVNEDDVIHVGDVICTFILPEVKTVEDEHILPPEYA
jgi:pyruvate/2-oxoglutarate dehydrogenase complex dihydrolipoamide acyltransferase (E2) component